MPKGNRVSLGILIALALALSRLEGAQGDVNTDGAMLSGSYGGSWSGGALSAPGVATAFLEGAFDERHREVNGDSAVLNGAPEATATPTPSDTAEPLPTSTISRTPSSTSTTTRTNTPSITQSATASKTQTSTPSATLSGLLTATPTNTIVDLPLNPTRLLQLLSEFGSSGIGQEVLLHQSQSWYDPE